MASPYASSLLPPPARFFGHTALRGWILGLLAGLFAMAACAQQGTAAGPTPAAGSPGGSLTSSDALSSNGANRRLAPGRAALVPDGEPRALAPRPPYVPGEFEVFVQRLAGTGPVQRFGAELVTTHGEAPDPNPPVPPDYVVGPGDELLITLWGSVDGELRAVVDRNGRVSLPRVGTAQVAGTRFADLPAVIARQVGQTFKNFQLSVSLGQLHGIRVFVTGFVVQPGAYMVSGLSSLSAALMQAGGPSAAGSFRSIELRQGGQTVATFDLYDLLLRGDRSADRQLKAGDVVHVGPVGLQVGAIGSVNRPGVFELRPQETIADVLRMAGGLTAVADRSRLAIERLDDRSSTRIAQLALPGALGQTLATGDVLRAFSAVSSALPSDRQSKRVRVEGEVRSPGEYVLPASSSVSDALQAAGGLTPFAYLFATEFTRESARATQRENYERALRDLETDLARSASSQRLSSSDDALAAATRNASATRLVERLRALQPTGRIVLQLQPGSQRLPDIALEDGDRVYIPARPTTVGVFGSVFNGASYLYSTGRSLEDYLRLAGGPTRGADSTSMFVVRANGSVVSRPQREGWLAREGSLGTLDAEPGDTLFVPEDMNKTTFLQTAKDWTLLLYQLGIGLAGITNALR